MESGIVSGSASGEPEHDRQEREREREREQCGWPVCRVGHEDERKERGDQAVEGGDLGRFVGVGAEPFTAHIEGTARRTPASQSDEEGKRSERDDDHRGHRSNFGWVPRGH